MKNITLCDLIKCTSGIIKIVAIDPNNKIIYNNRAEKVWNSNIEDREILLINAVHENEIRVLVDILPLKDR